jgi:hypothetical protein
MEEGCIGDMIYANLEVQNKFIASNISFTTGDTISDLTIGGDILADTNEEKNIFTAVTSNNINIGGTGSTVICSNLTIDGTLTSISSINTTITDKIIELANGTTGTPSGDSGFVIERGDSNNAFIGWDESEDKFTMGTGTFTGASTGNLTITSGTLALGGLEVSSNVLYADSSQVGIGTSSPTTSAALDITSTTGSLLIPRMNETQRDALTSVAGMIVYNTSSSTFQNYISSWENIGGLAVGTTGAVQLSNGSDEITSGNLYYTTGTDTLNINAVGGEIQINSVEVLNPTTLGSAVVASSLTSVGTLSGGSINWSGSISTSSSISGGTLTAVTSVTSPDYISGGISVLNATTLGSAVVTSSLTSVGTLSGGSINWSGSISTSGSIYGGTITAVTSVTSPDYISGGISVLNATTLGSAVVTSSLTSVGALNSGSITSGFGTIDNGSSSITTTGTINGGGLVILDSGTADFGNSGDMQLYHDSFESWVENKTGDLNIKTTTTGGGVNIDAVNDTINIKYSTVIGATFNTSGLNLVSGDAYYINSASVLNATTLGTGVLTSSLTTVGALNAGSITSGFGTIDNGSSSITTTGTITGGTITDGTFTTTAGVMSGASLAVTNTTETYDATSGAIICSGGISSDGIHSSKGITSDKGLYLSQQMSDPFSSDMHLYLDASDPYNLGRDVSGHNRDAVSLSVKHVTTISSRDNVFHFDAPINTVGIQCQRIMVEDNTVADIVAAGNKSITFWMNCSSSTDTRNVMMLYDESDNGNNERFQALTWANGVLRIKMINSSGTTQLEIGTDASVCDDTWHFIHCIISSDGAKLYDNNVEQSTTFVTTDLNVTFADISATIDTLCIGAQPHPSNVFYRQYDGYFGDIVFWNRVLTEAEATLIFADDYGYTGIGLFGQSNMKGSAGVDAGIDDDYSLISGRVFQYGCLNDPATRDQSYEGTSITAATNALDHYVPGTNTTGFWKTFCESILNTLPVRRKILLLPGAEGSTGFGSSSGQWNVSTGYLYANMVAQSNAAMALRTTCCKNTITGVLWHQGESDTGDRELYFGWLNELIENAITDIGEWKVDTPFIMGTLRENSGGAKADLNNRFRSYANNINRFIVELADLPSNSVEDTTHFSPSSYREGGIRYSQKYKQWLNNRITSNQWKLKGIDCLDDTITVTFPISSNNSISGGTITDGTFTTTAGAISGVTSIGAIGDLTIYDANNDGNPLIYMGSSVTNTLKITSSYHSGAQTLEKVIINTITAGASADDGRIEFQVDEVAIGQFRDDGFNVESGMVYKINDTSVLSSNTLGTGVLTSSLTTVGALNSGSITSGFGTIDTGSSTIDTTGQVTVGSLGVGITPPVNVLHVYENTSTTDTSTGVTIENGGTGDAMLHFLLTDAQRYIIGIDNSDSDNFKIGAGTFDSSRMTITTTGNIGFGTDSPLNKVDIEGSCAIGASYSGTSTAPTNGLIVQGSSIIGGTTELGDLSIYGEVGTTIASDVSKANVVCVDTSATAANVGGGISFSFKYNSTDYLGSCPSIRSFKTNATFNNYSCGLVFCTREHGSTLTERWFIAHDGGLYADATAGSQGNGTLNAVGVYDNGILLTDYVFEKEYLGKPKDSKHANYERKTLVEEIRYTQEEFHLSTIIGRDEWEANGKSSLGKIVTQLWETVETQFLYIKELKDEIDEIKRKINL